MLIKLHSLVSCIIVFLKWCFGMELPIHQGISVSGNFKHLTDAIHSWCPILLPSSQGSKNEKV